MSDAPPYVCRHECPLGDLLREMVWAHRDLMGKMLTAQRGMSAEAGLALYEPHMSGWISPSIPDVDTAGRWIAMHMDFKVMDPTKISGRLVQDA